MLTVIWEKSKILPSPPALILKRWRSFNETPKIFITGFDANLPHHRRKLASNRLPLLINSDASPLYWLLKKLILRKPLPGSSCQPSGTCRQRHISIDSHVRFLV